MPTDYAPVLYKADFVGRYAKGEFGNHVPTWNNPNEYLDTISDGFTHLLKHPLHIRNRIAGGPTWYNVKPVYLPIMWDVACTYCGHDNLYLSLMAPEDKKVFQGEVMRGYWGLDLYYNRQPLPMREGFEVERLSASGIIALSLLQWYLCPNSYEWLQTLLDRYPNHVVEFSTYSINFGTLPNFNTIVWEVRSY